jgi:hypothetical protein
VFRISKVKAPVAQLPQERFEGGFVSSALDRFCVTDEWSGDLANGLFQLGALSEQLHGLEGGECGLLTLLRCYDAADRINILELLENASSSASSSAFRPTSSPARASASLWSASASPAALANTTMAACPASSSSPVCPSRRRAIDGILKVKKRATPLRRAPGGGVSVISHALAY